MPQLVFLHGPGAGGCAEGFQYQLTSFPGSLAPTLPGHLRGAPCPSVARYTEWLRGWLWAQGHKRDLILVGFTLGACIALQYGLDYPEEVRGLVLMTVFLTLGHRGLEAFAGMAEHWFLVRLVEPPEPPPPLDRHLLVIGRGPFRLADERAMLADHRIGAVVCKASGGTATEAKILAARALGLPVIMLRRPAAEPGRRVAGVDAALDWIAGRLDRRTLPGLTGVAAQ